MCIYICIIRLQGFERSPLLPLFQGDINCLLGTLLVELRQTICTSQLATFFLVILYFLGCWRGHIQKNIYLFTFFFFFPRRGSRVKQKCGILHSSFHQDVACSRSFPFILNSSRTTCTTDLRVLQHSRSCYMRTCQIHLKSEEESKYLTTLLSLFRYFLHSAAQPFDLGVCATHLCQRRLVSLKQNRLV